MKRRLNPRLVKMHRNYEVGEIATLLGVHKNTVRNWIRNGLSPIDDRRPTIILGVVLREFLVAARKMHKQPCKIGELYCVRCRSPKEPAGRMVDYVPFSDAVGNLRGICPDCDGYIFRRVSWSKLDDVCDGLDVAFPEGEERISKAVNPSLNCDSDKEARTNEDA